MASTNSSNSSLKPIKIWGAHGSNPPKVIMVCAELDIPYEIEHVEMSKVKEPEYVEVNPNGRLPSIEDPNNNNLRLWESGAILEYLVERYDKDNVLSFAQDTPEFWHSKQWLYYQVSGQGVPYGAAFWFTNYHHEKLESAQQRYYDEMKRVTQVLEGQLTRQKKHFHTDQSGPWLVGNKMTASDIAFMPWQVIASTMLNTAANYDANDYPLVTQWVKNMQSRPKLGKIMAEAFPKKE